MTTAELEKRVRTLEKEVKHLQQAVAVRPRVATFRVPRKKMPAGLRQGLKEWREGKISGPFDSVEELMEHLEK